MQCACKILKLAQDLVFFAQEIFIVQFQGKPFSGTVFYYFLPQSVLAIVCLIETEEGKCDAIC